MPADKDFTVGKVNKRSLRRELGGETRAEAKRNEGRKQSPPRKGPHHHNRSHK